MLTWRNSAKRTTLPKLRKRTPLANTTIGYHSLSHFRVAEAVVDTAYTSHRASVVNSSTVPQNLYRKLCCAQCHIIVVLKTASQRQSLDPLSRYAAVADGVAQTFTYHPHTSSTMPLGGWGVKRRDNKLFSAIINFHPIHSRKMSPPTTLATTKTAAPAACPVPTLSPWQLLAIFRLPSHAKCSPASSRLSAFISLFNLALPHDHIAAALFEIAASIFQTRRPLRLNALRAGAFASALQPWSGHK